MEREEPTLSITWDEAILTSVLDPPMEIPKPVDLMDSTNRFARGSESTKVKRCVSELNQKFVQFCAHYRSELVVTRERVGDLRRL